MQVPGKRHTKSETPSPLAALERAVLFEGNISTQFSYKRRSQKTANLPHMAVLCAGGVRFDIVSPVRSAASLERNAPGGDVGVSSELSG